MAERDPFYIYKTVVNREKINERTEVFVLLKERKFISANKLFHANQKLRLWTPKKKLLNRLSRRAPLNSFINFYRILKLMAELLEFNNVAFLKRVAVRWMINTDVQEC